ncbi:uncharacterized protein MONOS_6623 [Monocercomonoides exilis]|uniref:uncharacterized protein n=1 Tax=Monocercomonoides exilis TaxID=2049356 RepID=UPI00355A71FE|nr:hypothetical protein MONOS_6623 [Monocercomonoides exilis]|eukprot:MONOS_6623.1-p1 / transcript=MONOS_6623.1 / gene=MONOS_6623 / organism=Monocercomonoides_exilis_PA203 / gene_product=unspecified product / transcript_product=unspecified product / location=Mono_scaffold00211:84501-84755(-) / protein_length=85 / sequence_SO=supercontig / SO=protein_coding / is_pseudo=false
MLDELDMLDKKPGSGVGGWAEIQRKNNTKEAFGPKVFRDLCSLWDKEWCKYEEGKKRDLCEKFCTLVEGIEEKQRSATLITSSE